jgi:hypothetical protein
MFTVNCLVDLISSATTLTLPLETVPLSQLVTHITGVIQLPGWTFSTVKVTVPVILEPGLTLNSGLLVERP